MAIAFGSSASLSGLFSARPAPDAGQVGRFYLATDTGVFYRDNGTSWDVCGRSAEVIAPTVVLIGGTIFGNSDVFAAITAQTGRNPVRGDIGYGLNSFGNNATYIVSTPPSVGEEGACILINTP